jgi:type I restriction enzyme S subunit
LAVQQQLHDEIKSKFMIFDEIITRLQKQIATVTEYRTRLISDVVSGKVNVQNVKVPEFEGENELSLDIRQETEGEAIDE